ncbi:MAG: hypothetical protein IPL74_19120 [Bacteroidetes bacterium]|nr:hypothetical protein [Bacteroidota bacterium]
MIDFINKTLSKLFGNKADRDLKELVPVVSQIKEAEVTITQLNDDQLREKTSEFKKRIQDYIVATVEERISINDQIEKNPTMEMGTKEDLYRRIDELQKEENSKIEEILNEILPEAFGVVRETARRFSANSEIRVKATQHDRDLSVKKSYIKISGDDAIYSNTWMAAGNSVTWNMIHYDVQLIGGSVLHQGKIAEMATGEGKTLVATLPIYLNALAGKGVHIVTVNDYLAKRDSEWNGTIFEFLGLTVDCIDKHQPNSDERKKAYLSDITYGTNNEFGFDYLRDNMARSPLDMVQRGHHFAIVDEVDSALIDDARTPLIISGPTPKGDSHEFFALKPRIENLVSTQRNYINTVIADAKKKIAEGKENEAGLPLLRAFRGLPRNKALIKFLSEQGVRALLQKPKITICRISNVKCIKLMLNFILLLMRRITLLNLQKKVSI